MIVDYQYLKKKLLFFIEGKKKVKLSEWIVSFSYYFIYAFKRLLLILLFLSLAMLLKRTKTE